MKTVKKCRSEISRDPLSYLFAFAFAGKNLKKETIPYRMQKKGLGRWDRYNPKEKESNKL